MTFNLQQSINNHNKHLFSLTFNVFLSWPRPCCSVIGWIEEMLERDVNDNKKIGNYGAQHILSGVPRDSVTILTHCNTGSLATAGYGTALGESACVLFMRLCRNDRNESL